MSSVSFIEQRYDIWGIFKSDGYGDPHDFIAKVARTCYQSEGKGAEADMRLAKMLVDKNHSSMIEHSFISVRFVTDRAIANEIVRHRHFSFAQESTRYVNYDNRGFEFIIPPVETSEERLALELACEDAALAYEHLIGCGVKPEIARAVLPLCTATRIVVSGNTTAWRHFFELRCSRQAHPQIRELANNLLNDLKQRIPVLFDDIQP